jgi:hypothetical protein
MIRIELLYFESCPSWQEGLENLQQAVARLQLDARISLVNITDDDQAQQEKFCGSPTFRVNGADLWCEERAEYHLSCRVYHTAQGLQGSPTVEMLCEEIRNHLRI